MAKLEKQTTASAVCKRKKHFLVERDIAKKTARLIEVVSPNVLRVDNSGRQEEVQLLGLMDMSPKRTAKCGLKSKNKSVTKLNNKSLKIYTPKCFQRRV